MLDILGKLIRHRGFEAGAQGIVIVRRLFPGLPPFAAVIEAWDAWHPKQQAIGEWDMLIVGQYAGKPGYIMVIYESYQMLAPGKCTRDQGQTAGAGNGRSQKDS